MRDESMEAVLRIGPQILAVPVIHGSADCALEVRRIMLRQSFDCVAVPLPPSFQTDVEAGVAQLPTPGIVLQREQSPLVGEWSDDWDPDEEDREPSVSYVPIDPCQPVIAALRIALGERLPRAFIDLETRRFESLTAVLPDAYALKKVALHRFAAAMLPSLLPPPEGRARDRIVHMAATLRQLEKQYHAVLFVCSVLDWAWIRDAYHEQSSSGASDEAVEETERYGVHDQTLLFLLGELPYITHLYERARAELEDDENLSIDGVKQLLLSARDAYRREFKGRARSITPQGLKTCLKYIRNLTLSERRLTPDLYTIVIAAKQVFGDSYALHVAETAREYGNASAVDWPQVQMGIDQLRLPTGDRATAVNRLPGPPLVWRTCQLQRRPERQEQKRWKMQWNPAAQCSWPPEDDQIENFRAYVVDRARKMMGADLVKTEKFTTSIKDGIDIRDTLRNWHTGEIYVKILPPNRGTLDAVVMLFDSPADPRDYPWRSTWFAEHQNESTLAFFATNYFREMVGPGIGLATYGGALFLFPPVAIPDVWHDPRLDFAETLEERLLAAACLHSRCPQIALLSNLPPGAGWRRLARYFKKRWIHVPLAQFSDSTVQQLRMVHVLNGRQVRSYAAYFIRKA
jgi:hypothetical protein